MKDLKSRVSSAHHAPAAAFQWRTVIKWTVFSGLCVSVWLFGLVNIALNEITRGRFVLFHPSQLYIAGSTFLMLFAVVIISIQAVAVVNHLMNGSTPKDH